MLSLTQLAAYVAIIETGTFQKAAERLGVSQPTVSQSLRNLESYLGVALVLRNRGPLGIRKLSYYKGYKGFPEQSTPVFNFCLFINERQGIRLRYYKRSC